MRIVPFVVVLALAPLVVSCGSEGSEDGPAGATPTQSSAPPSTPSSPPTEDPLTDPTPVPTGKRPATTTVTGVVASGVEAGCLLLDTGTESLLLLGVRPEDAPEGARLRVTGSRSPDTMTTCQQGVPFQVTQVRPVED